MKTIITYVAFALSLVAIIALAFSFYWVPKLVPPGIDNALGALCNKDGGNDLDFIGFPQGCRINGTSTSCATLVCAKVK